MSVWRPAEPLATSWRWREGGLWCEGVPLTELAARFGTPLYVYSWAAIRTRFSEIKNSFNKLNVEVHYAVKANGALELLRRLVGLGAGFDVTSVGELYRVVAAGGDPGHAVFSGVGKTRAELREALRLGIGSLNVESEAELEEVAEVAAELGVRASVSLRVNPDVDPGTHPKIATGLATAKFGIPMRSALEAARQAVERPELYLLGLACHIGSQLLDPTPLVAAAERMLDLVDRLAEIGISVEVIDLGGGFGIPYEGGEAFPMAEYARMLGERLAGRNLRLWLEPGRYVVGEAGALLTRVVRTKDNADRRFVIVDAAMTELLRPALYDAVHPVVPVVPREGEPTSVEVVGPVCETTDVLATDCTLPPVVREDLLAVMLAGAYGAVMASNYNGRRRPAEVLVDGDRVVPLIRRESYDELLARELVAVERV